MIREWLFDETQRIMGRVIRRPKDTTPQKSPATVALLKQIPCHTARPSPAASDPPGRPLIGDAATYRRRNVVERGSNRLK